MKIKAIIYILISTLFISCSLFDYAEEIKYSDVEFEISESNSRTLLPSSDSLDRSLYRFS